MNQLMDLRTPHGPALLEWLDQIERDIPKGWCVTSANVREARLRAKGLIEDLKAMEERCERARECIRERACSFCHHPCRLAGPRRSEACDPSGECVAIAAALSDDPPKPHPPLLRVIEGGEPG